jgi:hypothetical protein
VSKIYCFDLDNTICNTQDSDYTKSIPYKNRIDTINKLFDNNNIIIIDTARGSVTGVNWYEFTKEQLKSWGLKFHTLRTGVKFNADFYIDDKSLTEKIFFDEKNKIKL